jgi:hypothetical protein
MKFITWGKTDSNTLKHWILGTVLFLLILAANYIATPEVSALFSVFVVASVWDYQQWKIKKAKISIKDILVSCLTGIIWVSYMVFVH